MKPHTIIGRGRNLWHAAGTRATSLASLLPQASDGCLVYDAKRADEASFVETVCEGPMLDESLPPGAIERLGQEWHGEPSSLDYVAPDVYVGVLRKVPGVRVGVVQGGVVVWEDVQCGSH